MESATITRTLEIDGMSGDACVQKVTGALTNVQGVSTRSVKVGSAVISADTVGCDAACSALGSAGFKAHEGVRPRDVVGASSTIPASGSEPKHTNQSVTTDANAAASNPGARAPNGTKPTERTGTTPPAAPLPPKM